MCANYVSWIGLHIDLHQNYGVGHSLEHNGWERHVTTNHQELLEDGTNPTSSLDGRHYKWIQVGERQKGAWNWGAEHGDSYHASWRGFTINWRLHQHAKKTTCVYLTNSYHKIIAKWHFGLLTFKSFDSLSIQDFINMPRKDDVFISLIATMKSLPNGILVCLPLNLLLEIETHTFVAYTLKRMSQMKSWYNL